MNIVFSLLPSIEISVSSQLITTYVPVGTLISTSVTFGFHSSTLKYAVVGVSVPSYVNTNFVSSHTTVPLSLIVDKIIERSLIVSK